MNLGGRDNPEHYSRLREVLSASRRALAALIAASGLAVVGFAGSPWALVPAALAAIFGAADAVLAWRGYRASAARDLTDLLAGNACRAAQARAVEYGVDVEALPAGTEWRYVPRDFEAQLRADLAAALVGEGPRLVVLSGEPKSGKTRAAFHALEWEELRDAWLVVPRDGASVEALLRPGALPRRWQPVVVWLDDLERYASADARGLHGGTLRNLTCDRPVALLATVGGRGGASEGGAGGLVDPLEQLLALAACTDVPVKLTSPELARAARLYEPSLVGEIEAVGLGRRMVAAGELRAWLQRPHEECREGVAVLRAAIDWRRAGAQRPPSTGQLQVLYAFYLPDDLDPNEQLFESGLRWARAPLPGTRISLLRRSAGGGYEPYDLAVAVAAWEWPAVTPAALARIVELADPRDSFRMAGAAVDAGEPARALELLAWAERAEDGRLAAAAAFNTGVLLAATGDHAGAAIAYGRADEHGSPDEHGSQRAALDPGRVPHRRVQGGRARQTALRSVAPATAIVAAGLGAGFAIGATVKAGGGAHRAPPATRGGEHPGTQAIPAVPELRVVAARSSLHVRPTQHPTVRRAANEGSTVTTQSSTTTPTGTGASSSAPSSSPSPSVSSTVASPNSGSPSTPGRSTPSHGGGGGGLHHESGSGA